MKFTLIWYDKDKEITRDDIIADNEEDAIRKGHLKYNGCPPSTLVTAIREEN